MEQQKQNTGAIFKNEKKTEQKHPDYRGRINANGKEMDIALWLKESAKGVKYFSVSLTEPYQPAEQSSPVSNNNEEDDDLPF